jgi:hydrogenase-4 component F
MFNALWLPALVLPPMAAAALAFALPQRTRLVAWINALSMPVSVTAAVVATVALANGQPPLTLGDTWRLDALSALMALLISSVATLAALSSPGFAGGDARARAEARTTRVYANAFAAMMLIAVSADNLGVMWVAFEATTIAAALLIPLRRTRAAVDASWKYLLIGSVGIALAFAGTVLAFVDYASTSGDIDRALNWTTLIAATGLHPEVARLAFVFLLVGFGTKAGLVPMHTWLPDAHAEAPAPLSAMMSGVLLAVGLYALARWKAIVDVAVGSAFSDTLLLVVAMATIALGSLSLLAQTDYKRLLAFSSIEHTGLACFGLALGPLGSFAALLHLTGHALAKSAAFLLSGRVLARFGTHHVAGASGQLAALPWTGGLFGVSALALIGLPPFGLFLSEVLLIRAGLAAGHPVLTGLVLLLMVIAFGSFIHHFQRMLLGAPPESVPIGERATAAVLILILPLAALAWIGIALPAGLRTILELATGALRP